MPQGAFSARRIIFNDYDALIFQILRRPFCLIIERTLIDAVFVRCVQ